jgi:hypothetical protein
MAKLSLADNSAEGESAVKNLARCLFVLLLLLLPTLAPALASQAHATAAQAAVEVYVVGFRGESLAALHAVLTGQGATITDAAESEVGVTIRASLPGAARPQLAQNPAISWVEPYAPLKLDNAGNAPEAQLVFMALNIDGSTGIQCVSSNGDFIAKG